MVLHDGIRLGFYSKRYLHESNVRQLIKLDTFKFDRKLIVTSPSDQAIWIQTLTAPEGMLQKLML